MMIIKFVYEHIFCIIFLSCSMSLQCCVSGMQPDWLTHIWAKTKRSRNSAAALLRPDSGCLVTANFANRLSNSHPVNLCDRGCRKSASALEPTRPHTHNRWIRGSASLARGGDSPALWTAPWDAVARSDALPRTNGALGDTLATLWRAVWGTLGPKSHQKVPRATATRHTYAAVATDGSAVRWR